MDEIAIYNQWITEMGVSRQWEKKTDGWWIDVPSLNIVEMGKRMVKAGARLITITALKDKTDEFQLVYHWDLLGQIYSWVCLTQNKEITSICEVFPGADWAEREIHDYFAITFSGRNDHIPLMLRAKDPAGVFLPVERNNL